MSLQLIIEFCGDLKAKGRSNSTVIAYKKDLEQLQEYFSKDVNVQNVDKASTEDLNRFVAEISKTGEFSLKTVSRKINSIKTFYKYLSDKKVISSNPSIEVKHPKIVKQQQRILSSTEYRALRDVARINIRIYTIVELLLQTGIRIGELARLNRSDIVNAGGKTIIKIAQFQSYPYREIELNEAIAVAINDYLTKVPSSKNGDYLFYTKTGRPLLIRNIRSAIDKLFEKSEIKKATVNDIRNTFIVYQLGNGVKLKVVAEYVGHQKTITTQRYVGLVGKKATKEVVNILVL